MFRCCFYPPPHLMPRPRRAGREGRKGRKQLARPRATLCQTGGCIRNNLLPLASIAVRRSAKGLYDLVIAATTNPQARMTTR